MRGAALALVLLAACGATQRPSELLVDDVRRFQEALRWRRYEQAAVHVPPEGRERFLDEQDLIDEDLRIDDYEVMRVKLDRAEDEAVVQVKYTWHLDSRGIVHETVLEQRWTRQGKAWRVRAWRRKHGEPMPFAAAPEMDEGAASGLNRAPDAGTGR